MTQHLLCAASVAALLLSFGCGSTPKAAEPRPQSQAEGDEDDGLIRVGDYKRHFPGLPNLGATDRYFHEHGTRATVDKGYLRGDWKCYRAGFMKRGAGYGETVVDGNLIIRGDNWILQRITVTGKVEITGSYNDISDLEVIGSVRVHRGVGNKTP